MTDDPCLLNARRPHRENGRQATR